jgi:hypothetical protein
MTPLRGRKAEQTDIFRSRGEGGENPINLRLSRIDSPRIDSQFSPPQFSPFIDIIRYMAQLKTFRFFVNGTPPSQPVVIGDEVKETGAFVSVFKGAEKIATFNWASIAGWRQDEDTK